MALTVPQCICKGNLFYMVQIKYLFFTSMISVFILVMLLCSPQTSREGKRESIPAIHLHECHHIHHSLTDASSFILKLAHKTSTFQLLFQGAIIWIWYTMEEIAPICLKPPVFHVSKSIGKCDWHWPKPVQSFGKY